MKIIITFLIIIIVTTSCQLQPKEFSLIGEWKEIEYQSNNGREDIAEKLNDGRTIIFENANIVKDGLGNSGTYKLSGDSLHIILPTGESYYRFHHGKYGDLMFTPVTDKYEIICDEGCAYIYKKIK